MARKRRFTAEDRRRMAKGELRRGLMRIVMVGVLGAGVYLLSNPGAIENPKQREKVEAAREKLVESGSEGGDQLKVSIDSAKEYVKEAFETTKIPKNLTGGEEEIVVEELVNNLSEEVKQLPAEQVKKVKIQFCQDVINEATGSANSE